MKRFSAFLILCTLLGTFNTLHAQWNAVNGPFCSSINCIAAHGSYLYAGTDVGVYRSSNNGLSWELRNQGIGSPQITCLAAGTTTIYAGTATLGVYRSSDEGQTWMPANLGVSSSQILSIAAVRDEAYLVQGTHIPLYTSNMGLSWDNWNSCAPRSSSVTNNTMYTLCGNDSIYRVDSPTSLKAVYGIANRAINVISVVDTNCYVFQSDILTLYTPKTRKSLNRPGWQMSMFVASPQYLVAAISGYVTWSGDFGQNWYYGVFKGVDALECTCLAVSGNTFFVGTSHRGIFRSTDGGHNWQACNYGLKESNANHMTSYQNNVYCATDANGLIYSSNAGTSWQNATSSFAKTQILCTQANATRIFIGTADGVYRTKDSGAHWEKCPGLLPSEPVQSLILRGKSLFCLMSGTIDRSTDEGNNWIRSSGGLNDSAVSAIWADSTLLLCSTTVGVFRSTDDGASWKPYGSNSAPTHVSRLAVSDSQVYVFTDAHTVYRASRTNPQWFKATTLSDSITMCCTAAENIFVGLGPRGVYMSTDHANSWDNINDNLTNLFPTGMSALGDTLLLCTNQGSIYRSSLAAMLDQVSKGWKQVNGSDKESIYTLATKDSTVIAGVQATGVYLVEHVNGWRNFIHGMGPVTVQGVLARDSTIYAATFAYGIYSSTKGADWVSRSKGMSTQYTTSLCADSSKIYAGTKIASVFTTTSNGDAWYQSSVGLYDMQINDLCYNSGNLCAATPGGLYLSHDWAQSWNKVTALPVPAFSTVRSLGSMIYAGTANGSLYLSSNSGGSWTRCDFNPATISALALHDTTVYCAAATGVYSSVDRGQTWNYVGTGLNSYDVRSLAIRWPYLYAGTYEHGLWYLRLQSDIVSDVAEGKSIQTDGLVQLYPNPATNAIHIQCTLEQAADLELSILDIGGRFLLRSPKGSLDVGTHHFEIGTENLSPGSYLLVLQAGTLRECKRFVVVR